MAKLIYGAIMSVDGYIEDRDGTFDWAEPDEEVHAFVNDLQRSVGTYLYGRRMFETMAVWETDPTSPSSRRSCGTSPSSGRPPTRSCTPRRSKRCRPPGHASSERSTLRASARWKASALRDLDVSGPDLAAHAFAAGLVDECQLFVVPAVVGGGKRSADRTRLRLELLDERRFADGTGYLRYRVPPRDGGRAHDVRQALTPLGASTTKRSPDALAASSSPSPRSPPASEAASLSPRT